jgi:hypothetical protein
LRAADPLAVNNSGASIGRSIWQSAQILVYFIASPKIGDLDVAV